METDRGWLARSMLALAVCAMGVVAAPVRAQQQRPCQDDIKRLCPNAKPGSPEARKCLTDNNEKLSEACRQRLSNVRTRRQGYPDRFKGCESDLDKFCKGVIAGGGRLIRCLREHQHEISAECQTRLPGGQAGANAGGAKGTPAAQASPAATAPSTAAPTAKAQ